MQVAGEAAPLRLGGFLGLGAADDPFGLETLRHVEHDTVLPQRPAARVDLDVAHRADGPDLTVRPDDAEVGLVVGGRVERVVEGLVHQGGVVRMDAREERLVARLDLARLVPEHQEVLAVPD